MKLVILLQIAAVLHGGLVCAGATMPRAVQLRQNLQSLPVFVRRLFWVYYGFIGFLLVSLGVLTWVYAGAMAAGLPVARGLSLFMALFWLMRLGAAAFLLDVRPYLTTPLYRLGNHALNLVFIYLAVLYSWTAWEAGML
ncbi:MAG TPA: hypothetical protein VN578_23500 [Candidatus Binatia bacterium]|jgi:hypothetical protein|nr:hypothetical protein [Candidatus Binatia bacterium]